MIALRGCRSAAVAWPDGLWDLTTALLPSFKPRGQGGGSAPLDERAVFTAVVFVLTSGCAWRHLPPSSGVLPATAHRRFAAWTKAGLRRLHRAVPDEPGARGELAARLLCPAGLSTRSGSSGSVRAGSGSRPGTRGGGTVSPSRRPSARNSTQRTRREFRKAIKSVEGIVPEEWTPRELRHSFVSILSHKGIPLEEISRLVGHSGTAVTEEVHREQIRPVIQPGTTAIDGTVPKRWSRSWPRTTNQARC